MEVLGHKVKRNINGGFIVEFYLYWDNGTVRIKSHEWCDEIHQVVEYIVKNYKKQIEVLEHGINLIEDVYCEQGDQLVTPMNIKGQFNWNGRGKKT